MLTKKCWWKFCALNIPLGGIWFYHVCHYVDFALLLTKQGVVTVRNNVHKDWTASRNIKTLKALISILCGYDKFHFICFSLSNKIYILLITYACSSKMNYTLKKILNSAINFVAK